ncbi:hypothetical protein [Paraburkholderia susongensis]|uniref:Short chain dehydrogenase n=1 Tax=Paraburkholderia susongensis TaxID=1515439 RepID=A0A1X7L5J4_9BURK|nr:hypothetical protein [Paraburkholderia susongensis]SMG49015.1 hypothetical protein SAMN06265784_10581 [Paraburkholderia susongensis]
MLKAGRRGTVWRNRSGMCTGAGGGLGREIALGLAAKGYAVFGIAMSDAEVRELRSFGIDVVVAPAGNMKTGGPAKTASALARVSNDMTVEQHALYGQAFDRFSTTLNSMQNNGLDAAVGPDAEQMLKAACEKSDAELNALRLRIVGLD